MIALILCLATASALERPAELPAPLDAKPFQVNDPEFATLSNGLDVLVFTNNEVPLWEVRLVLGVGEYVDPPGKEGLAQLTFGLVANGTADRTGSEIARELQLLGGGISTRLDTDSALLTTNGIKRNLPDILDIFADVVVNPSFPNEEVEIARTRQIADVEIALTDPGRLSSRILQKLVYGDEYLGRAPTAESLQAVTREDVVDLYKRYSGPENALLLVGGDFTAEEVVPLLEERLGSWAPADIRPAPVTAEPGEIGEEVLYFVDNPKASQSVISSYTVIDSQDGPDWTAIEVANQMFARAFTARMNMNLREGKGYTYGARCYTHARHGAGGYSCQTSVRTNVTAASLQEMRGEIARVRGEEPLTDKEISTSRDGLALKWPSKFETISSILNQEFEIWRYGLSEDRVTEYIPAVQSIDTAQANGALQKWIVPEATFWLVVGDRTKVMNELEGIGLPIVELDRTGTVNTNK